MITCPACGKPVPPPKRQYPEGIWLKCPNLINKRTDWCRKVFRVKSVVLP